MSPRDWRDRVRDILEAISEIQNFTHGMDYETFKEDAKSIRAVEMNFIIISEAANQIPENIEENIPASLELNARHAKSNRTYVFQCGWKTNVGHSPKRFTCVSYGIGKVALIKSIICG